MKVRIVYAIIILGLETLLSLCVPYVQGAFAQSVVQAYTAQHLGPVWKPLALVVVVQFANSSSGLLAVRALLWAKFKLGRKAKVCKLVYEHLMKHEVAFHNSTDPTDISTRSLKKATSATVLSLYGPQVSFVLGAVSAVDLLLVLWVNRTRTVTVDRGSNLLPSFGAFAATTLVIVRGLQTGDHTVAPVVAFGGYMALAKAPMWHLTRIREHITEDLRKYGPKNLNLDVGGGTIEFKNVTFGYPSAANGPGNKAILKDLSLVVDSGQTTAHVGPSGCGKSTIINLVKWSYDPDKGTLHIDGQDIKELQKGELSKHISVMAQTRYLFNHTFSHNIKYGRPDATETELHDAADRAGIHDTVNTLPETYEGIVGEGGGYLSGGEKQRVALARTLLHDAPVLIFDEATSALDADTEAHVKESIKSNKTTVAIAHRLSTIMGADTIVVMKTGEDGCGEVAEKGTHRQLIQRNAIYAGLWRNQTGEDKADMAKGGK
ncbi:hypothetical protein AYO21_07496 [Fonsecaea monophora]|uniref:ABC transporter domain-containing protein n=1 Tax=Fonsecaea monophora TaxID=254056 RepID=A0A177F435_9EURO|nr:hypothetical protein AYO21_07496 [Fonsecaea monophora]OAG38270.1 hypothetical protein AYO21_07496 [Fonsecaea monophora]